MKRTYLSVVVSFDMTCEEVMKIEVNTMLNVLNRNYNENGMSENNNEGEVGSDNESIAGFGYILLQGWN